MPIRLKAADALASHDLSDWGRAKESIGQPVAAIRGSELFDAHAPRDRIGVWECSPGRWRRQVMEREFAHFISGQGRFVPDHGEPIEIFAGDAVWFPAYTTGTWEIAETLRKTYVIIGFRPAERVITKILRRLGVHQKTPTKIVKRKI
jgi:hypothetical protein